MLASMRRRLLVAAWLCVSLPALAFGHTSVGGTGSGADEPDSDCLRWEALPVLLTDGGAVDAGDAGAIDGGRTDGGRTDAGSVRIVLGPLRCVEHATMFGCACALASPAPNQAAAAGLIAALAIAAAAARRPRPRRRERGGR